MTRSRPELVPYDPEIEATLKRLSGLKRKERDGYIRDTSSSSSEDSTSSDSDYLEREMMANAPPPAERTMGEHRKARVDQQPSLIRPTVDRSFSISPALIQLILEGPSFHGLPDEDPSEHIDAFLELYDTFKIENVPDEAIKLRLFPLTLKDRAKKWLLNLPRGSITTWTQLSEKFVEQYFPPHKTGELRGRISSFRQTDDETLYDAWQRFSELLRRCPHHGFEPYLLVEFFYNGLTPGDKKTVSQSLGKSNEKLPSEMLEEFEVIATESTQWENARSRGKGNQKSGLYQVDEITGLSAQVASLTKMVSEMSSSSRGQLSEVETGVDMGVPECMAIEQVDWAGNQQNNPYSQTYNPGW